MELGRRSFLQCLLGLPFVRLSPKPDTGPAVHYDLNQFCVAGFQHYPGPGLLQHMHIGEALELTAEPSNPHDPYAVSIKRHGVKLGYVPRSDNRHISRLLRQGAKLTCRVRDITPHAPTWQMLQVAVGMEG